MSRLRCNLCNQLRIYAVIPRTATYRRRQPIARLVLQARLNVMLLRCLHHAGAGAKLPVEWPEDGQTERKINLLAPLTSDR